MSVLISICDGCEHRISDGRCEAFPDGIPIKFLLGDELHTEPVPGDGGIVFKARNQEWKAIAASVLEERAREQEDKGEGQEMP